MDFAKDFEKDLKKRRLDQDLQAVPPKRMLAYQIEHAMARTGLSRVEMARRMNTSRAQLNRLLDPENNSVTLQTIEAAAAVLGRNVVITLPEQES